jgi:hypothetical protein
MKEERRKEGKRKRRGGEGGERKYNVKYRNK